MNKDIEDNENNNKNDLGNNNKNDLGNKNLTIKEEEKEKKNNAQMEQKEVNEEQKNEIVRETKEPTDISDKNIEKNDKKKLPERKISFGLNKSILADINIENSINSFFKFIPFNIPQKNDEKDETKKENEPENEPEIIVLDNTDESLKNYQQKMIDLREENNFLKNQIKEYVSKVAWLEEHFTIRQENANIQHLQELEHIRKTNEKETKEYNDKIKELEDSVEVLQTELRRQTDLLADEKDTLTFTTSANWSLEKRISELEDKLKIKNSETIDLKTQIINIKEQLESKTKDYKDLEEKYNTLKSESDNIANENEKFKKDNTLLNEKIKIYDNISKRNSKSLESKYYQNIYSPTTPKTNTNRSNSEYSFTLFPTANDPLNKAESIENKKDRSSTISKNSVTSSKNNSFIEDTDLNDLINEISFSNESSPQRRSTRKNLFEYNEKSTEDLIISESKDEDLIYNSTTQPQNILTEINLD